MFTWTVKPQGLSSKNSVRWNNICGALRINWTIRPNLTFTCIIRNFYSFLIIINFTVLQMLHGCRTDLILKYLVYSNKDRNFFYYLLTSLKCTIIILTPKRCMKWKWRLNLYDFYVKGFPCAIMKQTKSNKIIKFLVNL